ncbi:MAG: hypothetical protein ACYC69_17285 [Thermodesulfovibrionales bacterium]
MERKSLSLVAVVIVLMLASLSHAVEVKLNPGQKLALTDGSYLTLQGAQIAHAAADGKIKTFPQGSTIRCDHSGHVSIWGTGGTTIWGAGGTAITNSDLCRQIVKGSRMQDAKQTQKFEDPTFRKGFDDPLLKPTAPAGAGGSTNRQPAKLDGL